MDPSPLQLDRYFFTHSTVRANPEHNPAGDRQGSRVIPTFLSQPLAERPGAYTVEMTVVLDETTSVNPPYFFSISAFAVIVTPPTLDPAAAGTAVRGTGFNVLVGAIREHLATLTARGPWGLFVFGPLPPPAALPPAP